MLAPVRYQYSATFKPEYHEQQLVFSYVWTDDGSYKFRVMARGDDIETLDSDWSDFSETWDYMRPESHSWRRHKFEMGRNNARCCSRKGRK